MMKGIAPIMIGIAAVLLLVVIATQTELLASLASGFSVLSLSNIDFNSNDPDLQGQAWVMTASLDGSGSYAEGRFDSAEIKTSDGKTAQHDFTVKMNVKENKAEYPITNDYENLYNYELFKINVPLFGDATKICSDAGGYRWVKPSFTFDNYCIRKSSIGTKGIVGTPNNIFLAEIIYQKNAEPEIKATISNAGIPSARVGDIGYVKWIGSLVSGQEIPRASEQDICALYGGTLLGWKTVDCSDFETFKQKSGNVDVCTGSYENIRFCVDEANNWASAVNRGKAFVFAGGLAPLISGTSSNGKISVGFSRLLQFPVVTLKAKASWLGIYTPVGRPDILSTACADFKVGSDGILKATIKNIGDAAGSFDVSASCSGNLASNDRTRIALNKDSTGDVYLVVTAGTEGRSNCVINAVDINKPENKDTASQSCNALRLAICPEGQKRTVGNIIQECRNNGWIVIKNCEDEGKIADPITFTCYTQGGKKGGGFGLFESIGTFIGNLVGGIIIGGIILAIILVIAFIAGISIIVSFLSNWKTFLIILLVIGLLVAIMFTGLAGSMVAMVVQ